MLSNSPRKRFELLVVDLDRCIAEVLSVAQVAATERYREWHALVRATVGDSASALPPTGTGANAADVRAVLLAIERIFTARLGQLERELSAESYEVGSILDALEDELWTFRYRRLSTLVKDQLAVYIQRVAPAPSVSNVFAAAAREVQNTDGAQAVAEARPPRVDIILCSRCGAPRLEHVLYDSCAYCGTPFFPR